MYIYFEMYKNTYGYMYFYTFFNNTMILIVLLLKIKGVVWKFWNFLYYWSDLTEIFTQYVKSKKKHLLFMKFFPFRA